jgi:hypothetical protein
MRRIGKTIIAFFIVLFLSSCNEQITFTLYGGSRITHEVNTPFEDPGINISGDFTYTVTELDTSELGEHALIYTVFDKQNKVYQEIIRRVEIVDTTSPGFYLKNNYQFDLSETFNPEELFASVWDNYCSEEDITISSDFENVFDITRSGDYPIEISLNDCQGNFETTNYTIHYNIDDFFALNGLDTINVNVNEDFDDPGVMIPNDYSYIRDEIDYSKLGTFDISYDIYNQENEYVLSLHRQIIIEDNEPPTYSLNEDFVYYAGFEFNAFDIFSSLSDNHTDNEDLIITNNINDVIDYTIEGLYSVNFSIEDTNGNITTFVQEINYKIDGYVLAGYLIENGIFEGYHHLVTIPTSYEGKSYYVLYITDDQWVRLWDFGEIDFYTTTPVNGYESAIISYEAFPVYYYSGTLTIRLSGTNNTYASGWMYNVNLPGTLSSEDIYFDYFSDRDLNITEEELENILLLHYQYTTDKYLEFLEYILFNPIIKKT